jgi:protein-L-isoaspartate(D-aspartate) O-methyltransferase
VPEPLLDQLARGGVLVMPLGGKEVQKLTVIDKGSEGEIERREVMPVRFTQLEAGL